MANTRQTPPSGMRRVRLLLWALVAAAILATAGMLLLHRKPVVGPTEQSQAATPSLGGAFTLVGSDGKPFPSSRLDGKPYALYFGYTRCGDTCPTTLQRLVKLRQASGGTDALNIVFITIDPANDGPKEVGQYASLFNSPIVGLTGSPAQIDAVKKQFGIFAEPESSGHAGMVMNHTGTVLLFDSHGKFASTIATDEGDGPATAKLKRLVNS